MWSSGDAEAVEELIDGRWCWVHVWGGASAERWFHKGRWHCFLCVFSVGEVGRGCRGLVENQHVHPLFSTFM